MEVLALCLARMVQVGEERSPRSILEREGLRPTLDELPDDRRERLAAERTKVLSERHWPRPCLQD